MGKGATGASSRGGAVRAPHRDRPEKPLSALATLATAAISDQVNLVEHDAIGEGDLRAVEGATGGGSEGQAVGFRPGRSGDW